MTDPPTAGCFRVLALVGPEFGLRDQLANLAAAFEKERPSDQVRPEMSLDHRAWPDSSQCEVLLERVAQGAFDYVVLIPPCKGFSRARYSNVFGPPR